MQRNQYFNSVTFQQESTFCVLGVRRVFRAALANLNNASPDYTLPAPPGKCGDLPRARCLDHVFRNPSVSPLGTSCPLGTIRNLRFLILPVLISLPLPSFGCEVPKRVFGSIEVLLDVARPDLFSPTPNTRLPSTTLGVAEASIYTRVYYWFFFGLLCSVLFGRCMRIAAHFYI